ncbi:MAG: amidohydrolase family protein [Micropepsaceae bacterium]
MTTTKIGRSIDRVDVHAHFVPGFYAEALKAAGHARPDGMPAIPEWNAVDALKTMDMLGVRAAVLSISSPGVHFGDDAAARALARRVNEEAAMLRRKHSHRFGSFATLPLPDIDGAVAEAIHALDTLGADGVVLESNHDGVYLGDPRLELLYRELDRRRAVIFIHPTSPACSCCPRLQARYPRPMLEFMFETTRSVTDMVVAGVLQRYPGLRVIVPHAGAVLPALVNRIELMSPMLRTSTGESAPSMREALRQLHFDLAGAPVPNLLRELLEVADASKLHYGSDYPFTPATACDFLLKQLETTSLLDEVSREAIFGKNSLELLPRMRS